MNEDSLKARRLKQREYMEKYRLLHPDRVKKSMRKYASSNRPFLRSINRTHNLKYKNKLRFGMNRDLVLKRDNYTCQLCGMTDEIHRQLFGRSITIDHKDGQGRYSKIKNHAVENLWTLCVSCHARKDTIRRYQKQQVA